MHGELSFGAFETTDKGGGLLFSLWSEIRLEELHPIVESNKMHDMRIVIISRVYVQYQNYQAHRVKNLFYLVLFQQGLVDQLLQLPLWVP